MLALEAAVTRNPRDGQAWHLLGKAHQEGDKDWQAVAALQRATRCDPSNLLGLVDQAVSYTNNMQKARSVNFFTFIFLLNVQFRIERWRRWSSGCATIRDTRISRRRRWCRACATWAWSCDSCTSGRTC